MPSPLRPLSFGEILDHAFAIYRRHFVVLYATALAWVGPGVLAGGWTTRAGGWIPVLGVLLLAPGWALVGWVALQRQVSSALLGQPVSFADGSGTALRAAPALWAQGVFVALFWFFFTILSGLGIGAGAMGVSGLGAPGAFLAVLIWLLGIGASQLVLLSLIFASPIVVLLEGRGPFDAVNRSMELARDALPRAMGIIGVSAVITLLPPIGLGVTAEMLAPSGPPSDAAQLLWDAGIILVGALTVPFLAACTTLLYFDRRVRLEALDLQLLTAQLPAR